MAKVEQLTDIPQNEVDQVVADFESEGANVTKSQQKDGNWEVTATFPD